MGAVRKFNDQEISELAKRLFGVRGFESLTLRQKQMLPEGWHFLFIGSRVYSGDLINKK